MLLIIGLGNPGKQYELTRHNTGWRALDVLAEKTPWKESKKFQAQTAEIMIANKKVILAKPQTFMNKSGVAVKKIASFYKIPLANILIIYDDIDLLVGTTRLRPEGSDGGHQGMASIITTLKTNEISRLKIGIAEKVAGKQSIPSEDYVLHPFSKSAEIKIKKALAQTPELVSNWIKST